MSFKHGAKVKVTVKRGEHTNVYTGRVKQICATSKGDWIEVDIDGGEGKTVKARLANVVAT